MTANNITNLPTVGGVIAPAQTAARPRSHAIIPQTMDECARMAKIIANSGLAPKSFYPDERNKNVDPIACCFVAIQMGAEVGLSPMAAIQNIAVVNGRPSLFGPAQLAIVEKSGLLEFFEEGLRGDGDKLEAWCRLKRRGRAEKTVVFTWAQAKKAQLTTKSGPWQQYPDRMMQARARTFALRDTFPDVLLGLAYSTDELEDIDAPDEPSGHIEHDPAPVDPPSAPAPEPAAPAPEPAAPAPEPAAPAPEPAAPAPEPAAPAPEPAAPKTAAKPIRVKVPGEDDVEFPQTDGLPAALKAALDFMSAAINDGGAGLVAANNKLLDRIADKLPEMAEYVSDLRAAAVMAAEAARAAEADPADTFVSDFVNGDDDFPGDVPPRPDSPS